MQELMWKHMKNYNIAIVGATGLVGGKFLEILDEYNISIGELKLFATSKSKGKEIIFRNKQYKVDVIEKGAFLNIDFALFSAGGNTSLTYAKQAVEEGATVIDNSSAWRMHKNVPLIVPEVNIEDALNHKLIANPNCSTIQCVVPLSILDKQYGVDSIEYNTYQAVSGAGQMGLADLENNKLDRHYFPYDIKATCIPQIDVFLDDGYTKEEHKMIDETRKILHNDNIKISATCVRVPVRNSHAVSIRVTLKKDFIIEDIKNLLENEQSIMVLDDPKNSIYPVSTIANDTDKIYIGRLRKDKINEKALLMYVVSDNIRKGAASNAIQIMKGIIENGYFS
jgi:aspartate-semialdehyde dehydrogenase